MHLSRTLAVAALALSLYSLSAPGVLAADDAPKKEAPTTRRTGLQGMLENYRAALDKLNLTADQRTKIDGFFSDAKEKVQELSKDKTVERKDLKEKVGPILRELTEKIIDVLTPEQRDQLKTLRAKKKDEKPQ